MKFESAFLMTCLVLATVHASVKGQCSLTDCLRERFACSRVELGDGVSQMEHEHMCCKMYAECYVECGKKGGKPPTCDFPKKRGSWNKREFLNKFKGDFDF
ncbi:uncharacterized protein LOC121377609 [Gigantopelta aegis]|uniref:uncharacterized protein LOC121377609 n=1 Tax=Gigantopelta aegis TaxID=1735272 RepID=UPI001B88B096|nr:uncharacterized protein LOC121377609 [Gigantopelta aegis]